MYAGSIYEIACWIENEANREIVGLSVNGTKTRSMRLANLESHCFEYVVTPSVFPLKQPRDPEATAASSQTLALHTVHTYALHQ